MDGEAALADSFEGPSERVAFIHQGRRFGRSQQTSFSSPGSASGPINSLQIQNFAAPRHSRLLDDSSASGDQANAMIFAPASTAHVYRLVSESGRDPAKRQQVAPRREPHTSLGSSDSAESISSSGGDVDRPPVVTMRPAAAHPKRRQSATANQGSAGDEVDAIGAGVCEMVSPPNSQHDISIGLLNNPTASAMLKNGRSKTKPDNFTSRATAWTIPNFTGDDAASDVAQPKADTIKRVERWLDTSTSANKRQHVRFSQYTAKK